MSCLAPTVLREPLIDKVPSEVIISNSCKILELDLCTMKTSDVEFTAKYALTSTSNDKCHGLVSWWDTEFSNLQNPVMLSTSPYNKCTHWKQTVFYFEGAIPIICGEEISGTIGIRKNPQHNRDVDIKISYHFNGAKTTFHEIRYYKLR